MRLFTLALVCVAALTATTDAQNPTIQTVELGSALPGYNTIATEINSRSVVAGTLRRASEIGESADPPKAFTWTRSGGFRIVLDQAGVSDINDQGVIVGTRAFCDWENGCQGGGYVWSPSTGVTDLGDFHPIAINNKGTIVGFCGDGEGDVLEGCIRVDGVVRKLPPGFVPDDINERGAVAGYYYREDQGHRAAVWAASFGVRFLDREPGPGFPSAINEGGMVVGSGATIWTPLGRASVPWGDPGWSSSSTAAAISDRGWIVGSVFLRGWRRPVLWLLGLRMIELPNREPDGPEDHFAGGMAFDVNDAGYIVGQIGAPFPYKRSVVWVVR